MPTKALMRLDVVSWKPTALVAAICVAWIIVSLIVGVTGPSRLSRQWTYAYQCPDNSHHWTQNCTGSQMIYGQPSPWIHVKTGWLDRTWHLVMLLLEKKIEGFESPLRTFTHIQARSSSPAEQPWTVLVANRTKLQNVICLGYSSLCIRDLLFWQNDPRYDEYRVQVMFEREPDLFDYVGDVGFEVVTTPDAYARISLGFKHAYGIIALVLTIFWFVYMLAFKKWSYSSWNWEQRYLSILLVGLNIYNNPIYGLNLVTPSAFFPFFNAFCEILYVGLALSLWLIHISRFRRAVQYENYILARHEYAAIAHAHPADANRDAVSTSTDGINGEQHDEVARATTSAYYDAPEAPMATEPVSDSDPIFNRQAILYIVLSAFYVLLTGGLFLWSALRDRMTPVINLSANGTGFQLMYYLAAAFYTLLVILLTVQLSFNALGTRKHKDILWGRYVFFAGPTVILAFSLVFGLFTSNVGPYGNNMVGVLCYSAIFNCYVYFMLWAYWPVEGGYSSKESSETQSIFTEAPSYASHL